MPPIRTIWGRRIAEARRAAGLTQVQLSQHLRIHQQRISNWERGVAIPRTELRIPIARALGVNANVLFAYPDDTGAYPDDNGGEAAA